MPSRMSDNIFVEKTDKKKANLTIEINRTICLTRDN